MVQTCILFSHLHLHRVFKALVKTKEKAFLISHHQRVQFHRQFSSSVGSFVTCLPQSRRMEGCVPSKVSVAPLVTRHSGHPRWSIMSPYMYIHLFFFVFHEGRESWSKTARHILTALFIRWLSSSARTTCQFHTLSRMRADMCVSLKLEINQCTNKGIFFFNAYRLLDSLTVWVLCGLFQRQGPVNNFRL